ncbi:MAG TPA: pentapeptide repeat-containing protein, partial [Phycisphaerae bacterium]|nr:pentapeptide repeat-containing protein [Phycisphaerae bacterium]
MIPHRSVRRPPFALPAIMLIVIALPTLPANAQIYNWQTGEVIPGTETITPGPGVYLSYWNTDPHNLRCADLSGGLDLHGSYFSSSWLDSAQFTSANLSEASFSAATLTDATFTGANLTSAYLESSTLTNADLSGANLTSAEMRYSTLANANFTGATIVGASFGSTTSKG